MESPFFRNRRWYQQPDPIRSTSFHPASVRGVPVYPDGPTHRPAHPQERRSGPKVVRIPVHSVGSEPVDRNGSAVKIQKVFRGFFVRKCLKKVKDVRVQVDEIGEKISKGEIVELLRKEEKERLRMNETLMSLLFKLDSICGLDFGVRGCRKAVTRKVIALQERIDAMIVAPPDLEGNRENDDGVAEIRASVESENSIKPDRPENPRVLEDAIVAPDLEGNRENDDGVPEIRVSVENENSIKPDRPENSGDVEDCGENLENQVTEIEVSDHPSVECGENEESDWCGQGNEEIIDVGVDWEVKVGESKSENVEDEKDKNDVEKELDDKRRNREFLEKMMEESEKMTKMMSQLYERNEMQSKMLNALTQRVEMLEKAFLCDKPRRKKNKTKTRTCKLN